ncbi:MAG: M28 family peptidase, partial [Candidatus Bathyarchaeia archaeon]
DHLILILLLWLSTTVLAPHFFELIEAYSPPLISSENVSDLISQIDFSSVLEHVKFFSNLGSRVSGYEGFYRAAEYIKRYWSSELGFSLREEKLKVTSPIVKRYSLKLEVPGIGIVDTEAYPLWPNHINPCPYKSPVEGDRLVYIEEGLPEDFNGVNVEGSFVLMDFNNRWYWKNAALFGAKGVIFLEPEDTINTQAVQKVFSIPINFPRLYVMGDIASLLKEKLKEYRELRIWIDSLMVWENKEVANIIAVVEGVDPDLRSEVAVVGAYYDSWSIIPQISPGATDSMGISFLMELARLLKSNPPNRTVWLIAFAGHYQALAGAREFVEDHFSELRDKIKMMISLDLASDSDVVAAYPAGVMYGYNRPRDLIQYYDGWMRQISSWLDQIEKETGEEARFIDGVRWVRPPWISNSPPFEPFLKYFEAEVFTEACYGGGLGFVTTNSFRKYQYTPFDVYERIQPENLRRQITILWPIIYRSVNINPIPYPLYPRRTGAVDHGLVAATLQLGIYNKTINMFNDYANDDAVIFVSVGPTMGSATSIVAVGLQPATYVGASQSIVIQGVTVGLFAASPAVSSGGTVSTASLAAPLGFTVVLKPDENGRVVLKGIKPYTGIDAQGYVLDPNSGKILCATDTGPFGTGIFRLGGLFGQPGSAAAPTLTPGMGGMGYLMEAGAWARAFAVQVTYGHRYIPLFNASSIALIGFFDPLALSGPQGLSVEILNFISHSYFVWRDVLATWPEAMVFMEPGIPAEIIVRAQGRIIAVLNNATESKPEGQGYRLSRGETLVLTILDAIRNMFYLTNYRCSFLESKMSVNPKMLLYLDLMRKYMRLADESAENKIKSSFYSYSIVAWQYSLSAYEASLNLLFDVVQTASFFFFVCAAFVIFVSRFIGRRFTGLKQMLVILTFFAIANFALGLVHPGYTISSNIWMLLNGLSVVLFVVLLIYVVIDELNTAMASVSTSILGFHRSDIERGAVLVSALSMGVENLKKRPIRTALSLSTIIITISAMTLFTTMGIMVYQYGRVTGTATYTGLLLKRPPQQLYMPISEVYSIVLPDMASAGLTTFKAMPRAWIYPVGQSLFLYWGGNASGIRGIMAISIEEAQMLRDAVKPGKGVTFVPGAKRLFLITESLAERLSRTLGHPIEPGKTEIRIYGIEMTVLGILDKEIATAILSKDLDQFSMVMPDQLATGLTGIYSPLDLDTVIIVPYEFALEYLNVQPNVIRLDESSSTVNVKALFDKAFEIVLTLPFEISYGEKESGAGSLTKRDIYSLGGIENLVIPLALSSLTILSMMLSAVYERRREIATLSTIGLSPSHIGAVFLMESIALAFLGSFLGYIMGAGITSILWNLRMFPASLVPNISSGVIIIVMGI